MIALEIWTDGANSGPKKAGGWAAILVPDEKGGTMLAISGYEESTTSNRMELTAVCEGLAAIGSERASVTIVTDSAYVKNAYTHGWMRTWKMNGWISSKGDKVANRDLWERLDELAAFHLVKWRKVKGHGLSVFNNLADSMAVKAKQTGVGVVEIL